ncbi:MAG: hypothetical protein WC337_06025 [Candidatus Muiribacteriota bacterium]|jgi:hypothetical protein
MIVVLQDETLLKKVIGILIELELFNSTILDGEEPETVAVESLPLFYDLANFIQGENIYNKTIIAHVPEKETIEDFVKICKKEGIDFFKPNTGWVSAFKSEFFAGIE